MALHTPVPRAEVGNTTQELSSRVGKAKQLVVDTDKNTVVIMDGVTRGGHPLAKESVTLQSISAALKINGGETGTLEKNISLGIDDAAMAGELIDPQDAVLGQNAAGKITTKLSLTYDLNTAKLSLNDKSGNELSAVIVPAYPTSPTYYARPALFTPNKTTITIPARTQVVIDGVFYQSEQDVSLSTASVKGNGQDVYVYACKPSAGGTIPEFVLSRNSTAPAGHTANTSRKIGGFHCLCAAVGTIAGHKLSGFAAGDIIPNSVWDLLHRPVSDPEGMVWVKPCNKWMDIYFASWNGSKLVSQFGSVIADGVSAKPFHGELFEELFRITANKQLLSRADFMVGAYNSPVHAAIAGYSDPNTTGGHSATSGRRIISDYGLEDCTGVMWQFVSDLVEGGSYGVVAQSGENGYRDYLLNYTWNDYAVYDAAIDGVSDLGASSAWIRRIIVGGDWLSDEDRMGSRCLICANYSAFTTMTICGRGVSMPLVVGMV